MLVYDGMYSWEGFGGKMKLGSGQCRLRIFDLKKDRGLPHLRPIIVIVSDLLPDEKKSYSTMTVKGSASHIATQVTIDFDIDPHRMMWSEYYPGHSYGRRNEKLIPDRLEAVEFTWHDDLALHARWRKLEPPLFDAILKLLDENHNLT